MILPREDLVWVRGADGRVVPFDAARLVASIMRAAQSAGYDAVDVAEGIAAAIHHFACEQVNRRLMSVADIAESVEALLAMLGHLDLARAYGEVRHRAEIRLDELAGRTAAGFELAFYQQLDAALARMADGNLYLVRIQGLRACVLRLRGARRWGTHCRRLADDILRHAQERLVRLRPPGAVSLQLAVTE